MRSTLALVALGLCFACGPAPSVESQVWSPYCPGRLLSECTTRQSTELRTEIAKRIERGQSEREVLEWVREEYGEQAIARPEGSGRGLVVWLVPVAIFALGALLVARFVSRNVDRTPTSKEETHADP